MDLKQHIRSLLVPHQSDGPVLQSELSLSCTIYGRISASERVIRIDDWTELLPTFRHHLMNCAIRESNTAQSYLWPYIWKGKDALCVGPAQSGKTTAFLVPLIGAGLCYHQAKSGVHQLSFSAIICPTAESVHCVSVLTRALVPPDTLRIVAVERASKLSVTKPDLRSQLRNGADIVIATPEAFDQIVDQAILSMKHCSRLVFDEADKLLLLHMQPVKQIYLKFLKACQHKMTAVPGLKPDAALRVCKTVIVAEKYTSQVADFVRTSHHNGIGVVTDNFETAVHEQVEFRMEYAVTETERKKHLISAVERSLMFLDRIIVCCCTDQEAERAEHELQKSVKWRKDHPDKKVILMNDETNIYDHNQLRTKWNSQTPPLIIVSDAQLLHFIQMTGIRNAQAIVHYSVPTDPKTRDQFALRFNFMSARFGKSEKAALLSFLILTKQNSGQAHEIAELYERLGQPVPEPLLHLRNSSPRGLCRRMASTGHCPFEKFFCYKDHFLVKKEDEKLPVSGQVKFFIGNIVTANEFYVRIMETRDESSHGQWIQYPRSGRRLVLEKERVSVDAVQVHEIGEEGVSRYSVPAVSAYDAESRPAVVVVGSDTASCIHRAT